MASSRDFGWWIESTDEQTYGPVTAETLRRFLTEQKISLNTLVRHCTDESAAPLVEQGLCDGLDVSRFKRSGDTLAESWPRRTKARLELGAGDVECARHRRPAILTCIRCEAPFCPKCQLKRRGEPCFMCKKCQGSVYNRRTCAFLLDSFLINLIPTYGVAIPAVIAFGPETGTAAIYGVSFVATIVFVGRDSLFGGAGPGKRVFGLRVVKQTDGTSPLSHVQGLIRWLSLLIPIFNLFDLSRPYRDRLQVRYGDIWAGTRVLDTPAALERARQRIRDRLQRKGIEPNSDPIKLTPEVFARLTE